MEVDLEGEFQQPPAPRFREPRFSVPVHLPKGKATASLVLGIIGLVASALLGCLWFMAIVWVALDVLAIIFGAVAISNARRGEASGEGLARAGLICGIIGFLAVVAWFVLMAVGIYVAFSQYRWDMQPPLG